MNEDKADTQPTRDRTWCRIFGHKWRFWTTLTDKCKRCGSARHTITKEPLSLETATYLTKQCILRDAKESQK